MTIIMIKSIKKKIKNKPMSEKRTKKTKRGLQHEDFPEGHPF